MTKTYLLFIALLYNCCNNTKDNIHANNETKPAEAENQLNKAFNYNLTTPTHTWKLPPALVEVSGNTWIDSNHLIFIEDLHPDLYYVKLGNNITTLEKTIPFADTTKEKFDIEDVTYFNNTVYALWSHGVLFKINNWLNTPVIVKEETGLAKENNTEGLCYDPVTKNLLIACKDASGVDDEKKSAKAVYSFDINTNQLLTTPYMMIHKKDFEGITGDKLSFNPSAIAVHPVTHNIYMLTTRDNKGMAIFTHDGKLISYQEINKEEMQQPEGLCFSPDGKLFISSEGKKGNASLLFEFDPK